MHLRTPVALAVALIAPLASFAQNASSIPADDLVVTATRSPQSAAASVRPVQVITAEDIRVSGVNSLTDVLRTLGGVETSTNGGFGQISSVYMRGANSDHTVVLIDGVRIGSASLGTAPLESIPLALIERVELLAGPSSSLYGADAIGGVIQIFTKSAQRSPGLNVALTAGDHGLGQFAASLATRADQTEFSAGANVLESRGQDATTPAFWGHNADRDGFRDLGLHARLVQRLDGGHELGAQFVRSASTVHYDAGADSDDISIDRTQTLAAHWRGPIASGVDSTVRVARSWDRNHRQGGDVSHTDTTQDQVSWLNQIALAGGTLSAGLEWLRQGVDSDSAYAVDHRRVHSALAGWRASYGRLSVQADVRHDRNSQFGHHTTAQVGGAWQLDPAVRLRGSVGTAFKAPTFNQLYFPDSWGSHGNPDLRPERSVNTELGADLKLAGVDLGATLFSNRIRDLINWVETPPGSWAYVPENTARARIDGLTLHATSALGAATRVRASLTLQSPEDVASGAQLQRRARSFANVHLSHAMGPLNVGTDLGWVGHRWDSIDEKAGTRMGGYALLAVFGTWKIDPQWSLEARVNNLADRHSEQAQGYASPGRQSQLSVRWTPLF